MPGIFISYRREGSAGYAGRLHEKLEARFGRGRVFRDVDTLEPGQDFVQAIEGRLEECRAFLALIGLEWLQAKDHAGRRRLDQPDDYLRHEIAAALSRPGLMVIPVLTEGATMPAAEDLPENLRSLTQRQAISLRDETWDYDVERLGTTLAKTLGAAEPPAREQRVPARPAHPVPSRNDTSLSVASIPRRKLLLLAVVVAVVLATVLILSRVLSNGPGQMGEGEDTSGQGAPRVAEPGPTPPAPEPVDTQAPAAAAGASLAHAKPIAAGTPEIGQVTGTASNFYRFDNAFKVRDVTIVRLENLSSTLMPHLKIYDLNKSGLSDTEDGTPGASVEYALTLEPGKRIYVEVLPCSDYGCSTGKYALRATPQHAFDALEPNDDVLSASPVKVGQDIVANIMDDKDNDWLQFAGAPQKPLTVTLTNQSVTLMPRVKVFNSNRSQVWDAEDGTPGANLTFPLPPEAGRDFYVEVLPCSDYGCSTGKYKLSVK